MGKDAPRRTNRPDKTRKFLNEVRYPHISGERGSTRGSTTGEYVARSPCPVRRCQSERRSVKATRYPPTVSAPDSTQQTLTYTSHPAEGATYMVGGSGGGVQLGVRPLGMNRSAMDSNASRWGEGGAYRGEGGEGTPSSEEGLWKDRSPAVPVPDNPFPLPFSTGRTRARGARSRETHSIQNRADK